MQLLLKQNKSFFHPVDCFSVSRKLTLLTVQDMDTSQMLN